MIRVGCASVHGVVLCIIFAVNSIPPGVPEVLYCCSNGNINFIQILSPFYLDIFSILQPQRLTMNSNGLHAQCKLRVLFKVRTEITESFDKSNKCASDGDKRSARSVCKF